jgi:hypothetical protein
VRRHSLEGREESGDARTRGDARSRSRHLICSSSA